VYRLAALQAGGDPPLSRPAGAAWWPVWSRTASGPLHLPLTVEGSVRQVLTGTAGGAEILIAVARTVTIHDLGSGALRGTLRPGDGTIRTGELLATIPVNAARALFVDRTLMLGTALGIVAGTNGHRRPHSNRRVAGRLRVGLPRSGCPRGRSVESVGQCGEASPRIGPEMGVGWRHVSASRSAVRSPPPMILIARCR
jgi:hypothetical protein